MKSFISAYLVGLFIIYTAGSATITVPAAGNCGDDTVLTCQVTGSIGSTSWVGVGRSIVSNGMPVRPEDSNKYTETRGTSSFSLTIHNTDLTDEGEYRCENGFDQSQLTRLSIECKAAAAYLTVTDGKKVSITVDKLYPSSPAFSVSFRKENTGVTLSGSRRCSSSTTHSGYYRCIWSSSSSLADESYTYTIIVTTITQADPLTGSFMIVSPKSPVIFNTTKLYDNRMILYGDEGQVLTIQCTSVGGFPTPMVGWYIDSISASNQLASTNTGTLQNDGTYTVTLIHAFTPKISNDKKTLICRSYYPQADSAYRGSKTSTVMLYLRLKPRQPTITQLSSISAGGTVEVRCTTTGSRPAATITWSYQGSSFTGQDSVNIDITTETYTVQSIFRRQVTAADNGGAVHCVVTHPTLVSPPEITASLILNVLSDPCQANPCVHGTCFSHDSLFLCQCLTGYTGRQCEHRVDPCDPNPCQHGTCFSHDLLFLCQCFHGFTGKMCEKTVNACQNSPCVHGTCFSRKSGLFWQVSAWIYRRCSKPSSCRIDKQSIDRHCVLNSFGHC